MRLFLTFLLIYLTSLLQGCISTSDHYLDYSGIPEEVLKSGPKRLAFDWNSGVTVRYKNKLVRYDVHPFNNPNRIRAWCGGFSTPFPINFERLKVQFKIGRYWGDDNREYRGGVSDYYYIDASERVSSEAPDSDINTLCANAEIVGLESVTKMGCVYYPEWKYSPHFGGEAIGKVCGSQLVDGAVRDYHELKTCKQISGNSQNIQTECSLISIPDGVLKEIYSLDVNLLDTSEFVRTGLEFEFRGNSGDENTSNETNISRYEDGKKLKGDLKELIYKKEKERLSKEYVIAERELEKVHDENIDDLKTIARNKKKIDSPAVSILKSKNISRACRCYVDKDFGIIYNPGCRPLLSTDKYEALSSERKEALKQKRNARETAEKQICHALYKAGAFNSDFDASWLDDIDDILEGRASLPIDVNEDFKDAFEGVMDDYQKANSESLRLEQKARDNAYKAAQKLEEFRASTKRDIELKAALAAEKEELRLKKVADRKRMEHEKWEACVTSLGYDLSNLENWPAYPDQCD